jgi:hypothetical protein
MRRDGEQVIRRHRKGGAPVAGRSPGSVKKQQIIQPDPARKIPIAITIAFEKSIRINQTLIFIFQSNPDEKILSRL